MNKALALTIAALFGIVAPAVAVAADGQPGYRHVWISKTPCTEDAPYANCYYDAGTMTFNGSNSYWATETDSNYAGAVYRCVRYLTPKVNRSIGGCGHYSLPIE